MSYPNARIEGHSGAFFLNVPLGRGSSRIEYPLKENLNGDAAQHVDVYVGNALEIRRRKGGIFVTSVIEQPLDQYAPSLITYVVSPEKAITSYDEYLKFAQGILRDSNIMEFGGTEPYLQKVYAHAYPAVVYAEADQVMNKVLQYPEGLEIHASRALEASMKAGVVIADTRRREPRAFYLNGKVRVLVVGSKDLATQFVAFHEDRLDKNNPDYDKIKYLAVGREFYRSDFPNDL